jgi:hypothetical protein
MRSQIDDSPSPLAGLPAHLFDTKRWGALSKTTAVQKRAAAHNKAAARRKCPARCTFMPQIPAKRTQMPQEMKSMKAQLRFLLPPVRHARMTADVQVSSDAGARTHVNTREKRQEHGSNKCCC